MPARIASGGPDGRPAACRQAPRGTVRRQSDFVGFDPSRGKKARAAARSGAIPADRPATVGAARLQMREVLDGSRLGQPAQERSLAAMRPQAGCSSDGTGLHASEEANWQERCATATATSQWLLG